MNYQEVLLKFQEFVATVDQRLLAAAAVLLLLLLLFWRVLRRTARVEREVARLNERLERIREEVRSISRPSLSVAPAGQAFAETETEQAETPEPPPAEAPDQAEAPQPEEDDVLSRAAASLAEAKLREEADEPDEVFFAEEDAVASDDSFCFDEPSSVETDQLDAASDKSFSFGGPSPEEGDDIVGNHDEPTAAADDSFTFSAEDQASAAAEQEQAATETEAGPPTSEAVEKPAPSGVVRLESDPARPGVSMVRCLSCNYKLAYPEKLAGKRVRCPSCRTGLDLP